jgi:hypothetical protein
MEWGNIQGWVLAPLFLLLGYLLRDLTKFVRRAVERKSVRRSKGERRRVMY